VAGGKVAVAPGLFPIARERASASQKTSNLELIHFSVKKQVYTLSLELIYLLSI